MTETTPTDQRIADAVRRTLEEHALCREDEGDTPMAEWNCDQLVLAVAWQERQEPTNGN